MPEHKTLAEFLSKGTEPMLSVRGYEVYDITLGGMTTYAVLNINDAEIVASGKDLSEAVEHIVHRVCEEIYKISQLPHLSKDMPSRSHV